MSFTSRVAKNTSILLGTHFLTYPISILIYGWLARHLHEDGFGRFEYVSSLLTFAYLCTGLGLDILLVREVARRRERTAEYLSAILSLKLLLSAVVTAAYYTIVWLSKEPAEVKQALYLAGLAIGFTSWSMSFQAVFNAHERMSLRGITLLGLNLVQLGGVIAVVLLDRKVAAAVLVYHVFGSASGMLLAAFLVRRCFCQVRSRAVVRRWKELLRHSLSFFAAEVAGRVYFRADIILLRLLTTDSITGWFSASKKVLEAIHLVTSALTQALYPAMVHRFASPGESRMDTFRQMSKFILLIALPSGLFVLFCARGIIELIFGLQHYEPSVRFLQAMGPVTALIIYDGFVTYFAFALHLDRSVRRVALVRIPLTVVIDYLLIKEFSAPGAVVALGLSNLYNLGCYLFLIRRTLGPLGLVRVARKPLLINGCFALLLWPIREWNVFPAMAAAAAGYAGLLWVFRELSRQRLQQVGLLRSHAGESSSEEPLTDEEKKAE